MLWLLFCPVFSVAQAAEDSHMLPLARLEDRPKCGAIWDNLFLPSALVRNVQIINTTAAGKIQQYAGQNELRIGPALRVLLKDRKRLFVKKSIKDDWKS